MSRSLLLLSAAVLLAALHATACGGRSPLATNLYDDPDRVGGGGGTGATGGTAGAGGLAGAGGSAGMAGTGGIAGAGGTGTGGTGGGLPTECLICAGTSCPEAVDCFMDQACQDGLICAITGCLSGGQPDVMCMLDCFNGDIGAAMTAGQAIYCIMQSCGEECGGLLPFDEG